MFFNFSEKCQSIGVQTLAFWKKISSFLDTCISNYTCSRNICSNMLWQYTVVKPPGIRYYMYYHWGNKRDHAVAALITHSKADSNDLTKLWCNHVFGSLSDLCALSVFNKVASPAAYWIQPVKATSNEKSHFYLSHKSSLPPIGWSSMLLPGQRRSTFKLLHMFSIICQNMSISLFLE